MMYDRPRCSCVVRVQPSPVIPVVFAASDLTIALERFVSNPVFVLADGPFADPALVEPCCAGAGVELRRAPFQTPAQVAEATAGADGVLVVTNPLSRELIEALAPSVRIVGRAGVGLDAIDLDAARERGIAVFHTPDYCVEEVATHTLALALALNRRLLAGDALVRSDWSGWRTLAPVAPLSELTVGVVGLGRIGRAVVERFAPLVREVIAYDPWSDTDVEGVHRVGVVEELLAGSDILTLHVPLTDETHELVDAAALARMKPSALLVNVSRGGLIAEEALAQALRDGTIAGAGLDVLGSEPPAPDHPLLNAPNVVLSPHFAWYSTGSERRVWATTVDGMCDVLAQREPGAGRIAVAAGSAVQ